MKNASNNVVKSFPSIPSLVIKMRTSPLKSFFDRKAIICIGAFVFTLMALPMKGMAQIPVNGTPIKQIPKAHDSESPQLKKQAVSTAKSIAATYPENALTHILLGSAYFNTGQTEKAGIHLKKCLELNPNILEAHEIITRIAYDKGNPEEALRLCLEARKRGLTSPALLNRMAQSQMDLGRTADSIKTLLEATKLAQSLPESFYLLGQAHMQAQDYELAKRAFLNTTELVPDHTQAYFGLFTACQRLGQRNEAVAFRKTFVQLESNDRKDLNDRSSQSEALSGITAVRETTARTFFGAGQIHQSQGAFGEAADLFYQSAALAPDDLKNRMALETVHVQSKTLEDGVKAFQRLIASQPGNALNHYFLGRLETRRGNASAAEKNYQQTLSLAPAWAAGYHGLAELYMLTNQHLDQAETLARKSVELEPNHARHYLLAAACIKNNHLKAALKAINQALDIRPDETKYQQLRRQLEKAIER